MSRDISAKHFMLSVLVALLLAPLDVCSAAELTVRRQGGQALVQGEHFRATLDAARGGEIVGLELFDGAGWNRVLGADGQTFPQIALSDGQTEFTLARDGQACLEQATRSGQAYRLRATGTPRDADGRAGPWNVRLTYEFYPEGAVFIDLECVLPKGKARLAGASVSLAVDQAATKFARYREMAFAEKIKAFESARVAFGVHPGLSYTSELQVMVERRRALAGQVEFQHEKGRFVWRLADGQAELAAPFRYENRVALALGAGAAGKPRCNVIGQRVFHWINFLDLKQRPQWYPSNDLIDRMAARHGTLLILHQHWMLEGGSNGKPHADYRVPRDEEALRRAIEHAHRKGMRFGLYMRGIERYGLAARFFQKYLKRNWDGLYVDWHGPQCVAYHEAHQPPDAALGDSHFSHDGSDLAVREYFLFTRKLRDVVGRDGFLIGHQGIGCAGILANLMFDGYLPGEYRGDHAMLADREAAVFGGMMGGGACMPWCLDSSAFVTAEGAAKMAAWGLYPHVCLGIQRQKSKTVFPLEPDAAIHQFVAPYWRILATINVAQATAFNLPSRAPLAAVWSDSNFQGPIYRAGKAPRHEYLVLAVNLGPTAARATVTLKPDVLGMTGRYRVERVDAGSGALSAHVETTGEITTTVLPPWGIEGFRLSPIR